MTGVGDIVATVAWLVGSWLTGYIGVSRIVDRDDFVDFGKIKRLVRVAELSADKWQKFRQLYRLCEVDAQKRRFLRLLPVWGLIGLLFVVFALVFVVLIYQRTGNAFLSRVATQEQLRDSFELCRSAPLIVGCLLLYRAWRLEKAAKEAVKNGEI